jgi:predicted esterase
MFAAPFVKSGRAVFGVVLRGYVERQFSQDYQPPEPASIGFRKQMTNWITDLRRGVDYLETRDDLDKAQIGFLGISNGANLGLVLTAIETRYKSIAFVSAGLESEFRTRIAETSPINFASQVRTQKIFINGRYDETFPYNTDAKPLFDLVRDPKKVVVYDGGHIPTAEFYVPALNAWFDETLGVVK